MRSRQLNNTSPRAEPISFSNKNIPGGIKLHVPEIRRFRSMLGACGICDMSVCCIPMSLLIHYKMLHFSEVDK